MDSGRYTISIMDMSGNFLAEQVGVFSSDADACTAARKLLRPGDRAIIVAGQNIIGRFSLAVTPPQAAPFAEAPVHQLPMQFSFTCQPRRRGHQISNQIHAWVRDWLWRRLAR
jgi:hypothetical protein